MELNAKNNLNITPLQDGAAPQATNYCWSVWCRERGTVLDTANKLVNVNKASIFRAGIWKPRTRPTSFEVLNYGSCLVKEVQAPNQFKNCC